MSAGERYLRSHSLLAWLRLARVFQKIDRLSAESLAAYGLSVAQFDVLAQLSLAEGISQQELADRLLVTKGNVSQLLSKMERRGLIRRCPKGRALLLHLTEEGRALAQDVVPLHEALIVSHFSPLDGDEAQALHALLRRLDRALD